MNIDDLKALKAELDEVVALRENLTATQERCNQLLEENRTLKRRMAEAAAIADKIGEKVGKIDELARGLTPGW